MSDELLNHQLGSYVLVQRLGRGAFGNVYLGKHFLLEHKPPVAVKVLNTTLQSQEDLDHFFQEAQLLDKLAHPNILPILDANIYEGYPFFVAEFAPNGSLQDRLEQLGGQPMPLPEAIRILTQIGQALQHAHDLDVVHRDLKPANILFNAQDDAMLADFGISVQLHRTSHVDMVGTPIYMAPEQFKGRVSKKSDQYALACIAYELLTGQLLFTADDPYEIGYKHIHETPATLREINPSLPEAIEQVVMRALAKDRDDRYPAVEDFILALRAAAGPLAESIPDYPQPELPPDISIHSSSYVQSRHIPTPISAVWGQDSSTPVQDVTSPEYIQAPHAPYAYPITGQHEPASQSNGPSPSLRTTHPSTTPSHITPFWQRTTGLSHTYYAEPLCEYDLIYVGTYTTTDRGDEGHFQVHAIDSNSGQLRWSFVTEHSVRAAPTISNGIVYVCTGNRDSSRDVHGKIYALDARTGAKLWGLGTKEALYSSPRVLDGAVYFHSKHALYVVDAHSGHKRWAVAVDDGIFAPPCIIDGIVYVSTDNGHCYSLDAFSGQRLSSFSDVGNIYAVGKADESIICVGLYQDGLYGDDALTGKTLWYSTIDKQHSGSGLTIDHETIYVASYGGYGEAAHEHLYAIDLHTGKQQWVVTLPHIIVASPVVSNGVIYVSTLGSELYAIDAAHGKLLASVITGNKKPTRPAVTDSLIAVSTGELYVYQFQQ